MTVSAGWIYIDRVGESWPPVYGFLEAGFSPDCGITALRRYAASLVPLYSGLVHTYQTVFFLRLPWHCFKNICLHMDPLKMVRVRVRVRVNPKK